ncbi:hypothetical protein HYZ78_03435 [Candidatus Microgenomates bacterium]|nr:hypothetical protein [Candidatus Microgenomates bacterium]
MLPKVIIGVVLLIGLFLLVGFFTHGRDEIFKGTPLENTSFQSQDKQTCPDPLVLQTPVDLDKVTGILYPGQERGGHFKYHGGFSFANSKYDEIEVRAPFDAKVTDGVHYIETGRVQYMFDFETSCGIKYRFDHLAVLSSKFAEIAENLPEAKVDDSRTTSIRGDIQVTQGEVIATAVGYPENPGVDFGVYESKGFDPFHNFQKNAICWFDLLPASDSARVKNLLPSGPEGRTSTICRP